MYRLNFSKYSNIFIDCDGVIIDSNHIKEKNISTVLKKHLSKENLSDCLSFFNANPGIPREKKLEKFILSEDLLKRVLEEYNQLNLQSLKDATLVDGVVDFLKQMKEKNKKIYMLSGGLRDELVFIFQYKKMLCYFDEILGGPATKEENIRSLSVEGESIFFGDSQTDLDVALIFKMDFIFISGYTHHDLNSVQQKLTFKTYQNFNEINLKQHD
jgi:phosphoglycolate phosphatase-like HAD superfamily hydrolase